VSKNKIKPIRKKIDLIDHQILKLIQKRGSLAQKIGDLKGLINSKIPFYKPSREAEILRNIAKLNEGPISDEKIKYIFKEIISSCLSLEEELARTWHNDMIWWGPAGIGATYTISRYAQQHSGPFRSGLSDRSFTRHISRIAEGHYSGFFGWPNFTAKPTGGYLGLPASDKKCEFRVIDIYRREGNKLKENWIFIDLLYLFLQNGKDILRNLDQLN